MKAKGHMDMRLPRRTSAIKTALAFLSGIATYQANIFMGGYLAAIAIPRSYFDWFGRSRLELALGLVDLVNLALPILALTIGLTWLAYRLLKPASVRGFLPAIGLGALAMYAYVTATLTWVPELPSGTEPFSASVRLVQMIMPPWWAVPSFIAPWLGFAIAGLLIARRHRQPA